MGPVDVVIPLGKGSRYSNWELRFALRSLCAYFEHRNVYLVGERPDWFTGIHIPAGDTGQRNISMFRKVCAACKHPDVSEVFLYMHDDHFFTRPMTHIPDYYDGTIDEWAGKSINALYRQIIQRTPKGNYYDNHTPKIVSKTLFPQTPMKSEQLVKSTYFNTFGPADPQPLKDCKIRSGSIPDGPFFSTPSYMPHSLRDKIESLYPVPSRYEADNNPKP